MHVAIKAKKPKNERTGHKGVVDAAATYGQAIGQLIVLDHHAKGPVVVVATDLRNAWTFFWLALCPKADAMDPQPSGPRKREVHWLSLNHLRLGVATLREILDDANTLTHAKSACDCGKPYKDHLTKFYDMEVAAAEALANAARLAPPKAPPAQRQDDINDGGATPMDMRYEAASSALRDPNTPAELRGLDAAQRHGGFATGVTIARACLYWTSWADRVFGGVSGS